MEAAAIVEREKASGLVHTASTNKPLRAYPFVSVLMPVRNEGQFIERSLQAVIEQEYPRDRLEVLIADGMSGDATREVIESMKRQYPAISLNVLDNLGRLVATGMNAALAHAKGEVIVRVDGHTLVAPNYVRECVAALQRTDADNVGGRMNAVGESPFGQAVALATSSRFGVGGARFHYSAREEWVDTVYMGAWRRDLFRRIGVFDEEMVRNQDDEFNYRLRAQGGKILLSPLIKSSYYNRTSLRSLWRQYFQYGFWKVRVLQKHPRQMKPRQFAPALFVAVLVFALSLSPLYVTSKYLVGLTGGTYVIANLTASVLLARRHGWRSLQLLPFVFTAMHFAYGSGFLLGLARFWNYWGRNRTAQKPFKKHLPEAKGT